MTSSEIERQSAYIEALISLVAVAEPARWSVSSTPDNVTAMGKQIVYEAFGGCTDDFYEAIKMACRGDMAAAQRLYKLVTEDSPNPFKLDLSYNDVVAHAYITNNNSRVTGVPHTHMSVTWVTATLRLYQELIHRADKS